MLKLTLKNRKQETSDCESFIFEPDEEITWKAGQFFHYILHHQGMDDRKDERWFTISAAPFENHLMITTRFNSERSSSFKKALKELGIGATLEGDGPDGDFVLQDPGKAYVFIAGGIGITPFRSILMELSHEGEPINVTLLYANRNGEIVFKDELEKIAQENPGLKIHYILDPERINEEIIKKFAPNLESPIFYVSGPEPMVDAMSETLKGMGIPEDHIKGDWFPGYPMD